MPRGIKKVTKSKRLVGKRDVGLRGRRTIDEMLDDFIVDPYENDFDLTDYHTMWSVLCNSIEHGWVELGLGEAWNVLSWRKFLFGDVAQWKSTTENNPQYVSRINTMDRQTHTILTRYIRPLWTKLQIGYFMASYHSTNEKGKLIYVYRRKRDNSRKDSSEIFAQDMNPFRGILNTAPAKVPFWAVDWGMSEEEVIKAYNAILKDAKLTKKKVNDARKKK